MTPQKFMEIFEEDHGVQICILGNWTIWVDSYERRHHAWVYIGTETQISDRWRHKRELTREQIGDDELLVMFLHEATEKWRRERDDHEAAKIEEARRILREAGEVA